MLAIVSKITVRAKTTAQPRKLTIATVQLWAGGSVKELPDGSLVHYTQDNETACHEWGRRGYDILACEELELGPDGRERLLNDLAKL